MLSTGTCRMYHCNVIAQTGTSECINRGAAGPLEVYNCIVAGNTFSSTSTGTLNQDYNIVYAAYTSGGGGAGANNTVTTEDGVGFAGVTSGVHSDFRVLKASEVTGTQTANGVDLTAIDDLDYDIDGRSRATYGYKIGISAGYRLYDSSDLPDQSDVRYGVVFNDSASSGLLSLPETSDVRESVQFGASGIELTGTLDIPNADNVRYGIIYDSTTASGTISLPNIQDVRINSQYGSSGVEYVGQIVIPPQSGVLDAVYYDYNGTQGSWQVANAQNYLYGEFYGIGGVSESGAFPSGVSTDYPEQSNVRYGILFNNGESSGNIILPEITNVRVATAYGASGVELTGTLDLPNADNVRYGIQYDNTNSSGTISLPQSSDVRLSTLYGASGVENTGTLDIPASGDVQYEVEYDNGTKWGSFVAPDTGSVLLGTTYGDAGEFVGTLVASGASSPSITPSGFATFDAHLNYGGGIYVTFTNKSEYSTGDFMIVYNNSGDTPIDAFDATVGSGLVCGLTDGIEYELYSTVVQSGYLESTASSISSAIPTESRDTTPPSRPEGVDLNEAPSPPNITGIS